MTDLKRCSRCKCTVLVETYFSKNRKGEYNKICNGCLTKMREMNKIKNVACKDCDAKFSRNAHLQAHIKQVHLKIKNFTCKDCDAKFSAFGDLQKHVRNVHLKIKDHECSECNICFSSKSILDKHVKSIHLKIKDNECPLCGFTTSREHYMRQHIERCTGESNCSSGEFKIKKILDEMNIEYDHDSSYEVKDKILLRWDFIIKTKGDPIFIEYDGQQHFEPVRFGGRSQEKAEKAFQKQKAHDKLKDDYCSENGFLLLRIAYTQFGNIPQIVTEFICEHTDWGYE